jgi:hypothetical protein
MGFSLTAQALRGQGSTTVAVALTGTVSARVNTESALVHRTSTLP